MKLELNNILFLDIETVSQYEHWQDVPIKTQDLYIEKTRYKKEDENNIEDFYHKAGIWAEFGRIICITVAYFNDFNEKKNNYKQLRIKSFTDNDELTLLENFKFLVDTHFSKLKHKLCAHNGKEFDFPYIARRMLINKIPLPKKLNLFGKKPWEIPHIDTLELWKFGDYKHYTSLKLLTHILGIPSPKQDIDGSDVRNVYYIEKDLKKIVKYCERDTIAVAQLLLRFNNLPLLKDHQIVSLSSD